THGNEVRAGGPHLNGVFRITIACTGVAAAHFSLCLHVKSRHLGDAYRYPTAVPMIRFTFFAVALMLAFIAGCDTVTLDAPIGTKSDVKSLRSLVGRWASPDGDVVEIRLGSDLMLYSGQSSWDEDKRSFSIRTNKLDVRSIGDSLIVYGEDNARYSFARLSLPDRDSLVFSTPSPSAFRDAVSDGSLDGTVTTGENAHFHVRLSSKSDSLKAILGSPNGGLFFPPDLAFKSTILKRFDEDPEDGG
ncbi:hypothetical protein, partial [Rubripirellula obstinata]